MGLALFQKSPVALAIVPGVELDQVQVCFLWSQVGQGGLG
jgi:hypothetical protein